MGVIQVLRPPVTRNIPAYTFYMSNIGTESLCAPNRFEPFGFYFIKLMYFTHATRPLFGIKWPRRSAWRTNRNTSCSFQFHFTVNVLLHLHWNWNPYGARSTRRMCWTIKSTIYLYGRKSCDDARQNVILIKSEQNRYSKQTNRK